MPPWVWVLAILGGVGAGAYLYSRDNRPVEEEGEPALEQGLRGRVPSIFGADVEQALGLRPAPAAAQPGTPLRSFATRLPKLDLTPPTKPPGPPPVRPPQPVLTPGGRVA